MMERNIGSKVIQWFSSCPPSLKFYTYLICRVIFFVFSCKIGGRGVRYQLPSQYNMKLDKMTMAASLEARVPLLDQNIITWSSGIPSNYKLNGKIESLNAEAGDITYHPVITIVFTK